MIKYLAYLCIELLLCLSTHQIEAAQIYTFHINNMGDRTPARCVLARRGFIRTTDTTMGVLKAISGEKYRFWDFKKELNFGSGF